MSCEQGPNKISRIVCQAYTGISQLASKRSFYAGVAVGATGTGLGMFTISRLRRRKRSNRPVLVKVGPSGETVSGQPVSRSTMPAAQGATRSGSRDKPIPLNMRAPSNAPGSRNKPIPLNMGVPSNTPGSRNNPIPLTMGAPSKAGSGTKTLPVLPAKPLETVLELTPIQVQTGSGQPFTPRTSYRVTRSDGTDTGLAITPYIGEDPQGQPLEDDKAWGVTHTNSGALISGPYESVSKAQDLATRLSRLRWAAPTIPGDDIEQAKQIIDEYHTFLAGNS